MEIVSLVVCVCVRTNATHNRRPADGELGQHQSRPPNRSRLRRRFERPAAAARAQADASVRPSGPASLPPGREKHAAEEAEEAEDGAAVACSAARRLSPSGESVRTCKSDASTQQALAGPVSPAPALQFNGCLLPARREACEEERRAQEPERERVREEAAGLRGRKMTERRPFSLLRAKNGPTFTAAAAAAVVFVSIGGDRASERAKSRP